MKRFKLFFLLTVSILLTSCGAKQIALNKQSYHSEKKVAVIINKTELKTMRLGSQGLLDIAVTPQKKYLKALNEIDSIYSPKIHTALINEVKKIYDYTKKNYLIIDDSENLPTIIQNKKEVLDYNYIKETYEVDEIQEITLQYGIAITYHGFIEIEKKSFVNITSTITNIDMNSIIQRYDKLTTGKLKGKWQNENYEILQNSLKECLTIAKRDFNSQF
ncbi:hypothetical protein HX049_15310 [Myroides odoratimimus]|uniref:hypothetical protein n=1 Tax=Myroides odoratimimus TaxID=76832 RepID=UPI002575C75C|nr:hypothetical protein [Myroides odoratimimus]MDM1398520.1 hypothetical protein [Myroides odoratimimus]